MDEAQNKQLPAQMKMFLTRNRFWLQVLLCTRVILKPVGMPTVTMPTGHAVLGLDVGTEKCLGGINDIGICMLSSQDVVKTSAGTEALSRLMMIMKPRSRSICQMTGLKKDEAARGFRNKAIICYAEKIRRNEEIEIGGVYDS